MDIGLQNKIHQLARLLSEKTKPQEKVTPARLQVISAKADDSTNPKVAIVTGSISDVKKGGIAKAAKILKDMGVEVSFDVISAHRTPKALLTFAEKAEEKGVDIIIAAAGGAAHLPAMMSSFAYPIKTIALPILTSDDTMGGIGSMLASLQMPPGAPVSSVGINSGENAALEALKTLALKYPEIKQKLIESKEKGQREKVVEIHQKLEAGKPVEYKGAVYSDKDFEAIAGKLVAANDIANVEGVRDAA